MVMLIYVIRNYLVKPRVMGIDGGEKRAEGQRTFLVNLNKDIGLHSIGDSKTVNTLNIGVCQGVLLREKSEGQTP